MDEAVFFFLASTSCVADFTLPLTLVPCRMGQYLVGFHYSLRDVNLLLLSSNFLPKAA
jgi:hypothetical protein